MATFTKIPDFIEAAMEGEFVLGTAGSLEIALSNTAPGAESSPTTTSGNGILANVTQIAYTNYSDDMAVDRVLEGITSVESGGVYTLDANDIVITAVTGSLPTFRYIYVFDQTTTTPTDSLIAVWDHGAAIDLALGESATIAWNAAGLFTIT
jgi:hypothetical protein